MFLSKIIFINTSHSSGVMVKTTFPVMDEVIWLQSMAEFVHQDYVKLIGNGGALKYSCALRPMPTLYGFHHNFSVCFSKHMFEVKKLKIYSNKTMKLSSNLFLLMSTP